MLVIADGLFSGANYAEAGLWILVAIAFGVVAIRRAGAARRRCAGAAVAFLLFGVSDVVEAETGAWWRPWWLLAWKATCIAGLLALLLEYRRRR